MSNSDEIILNRITKRANLSFVFAVVCSAAAVFAAAAAGIYFCRYFPDLIPRMKICCVVAEAAVAFMVLFPFFAEKRYTARLNAMKVSEQQDYLDAEKRKARESAEAGDPLAGARPIRRLVALEHVYYAILPLLSLCCVFLSASNPVSGSRLINLLTWGFAGTVVYACLYRVFVLSNPIFDDSAIAPEEEFPTVYSLARKAARECGVRGDIGITFVPLEAGAAIASRCSGRKMKLLLRIGSSLPSLLGEDEFYCVLLHEFSHAGAAKVTLPSESPGASFLLFCDPFPRPLYDIFGVFFTKYFATRISFESATYALHASEFVERAADAGAAAHCDRKTLAAALAKITVAERATDFTGDYVGFENHFFSGEKCPERYSHLFDACLRAAFADVRDGCMRSFRVEIQPKNATHPILRDRLASFGASLDDADCSLPGVPVPGAFSDEKERILSYSDRLLVRLNSEDEDYAAGRKKCYLDPLARIKSFEEAGRKCPPGEYREIIGAYEALNRSAEAADFCRSVIALPSDEEYSKAFPIFWLGAYLLNRDDPEGLPMVYRAVELNSNATDLAIDALGSFCCRNGLREEYDRYRAHAEQWIQHDQDRGTQAVELGAADRISAEKFPDGRLADILDFIVSAGKGRLRAVYLVRKTFSDEPDGYASQFYLEYDAGASADERAEIYKDVFNYLDSRPEDWEYALLDYTPQYGRILAGVPGSRVWSSSGSPDGRNAADTGIKPNEVD